MKTETQIETQYGSIKLISYDWFEPDAFYPVDDKTIKELDEIDRLTDFLRKEE